MEIIFVIVTISPVKSIFSSFFSYISIREATTNY